MLKLNEAIFLKKIFKGQKMQLKLLNFHKMLANFSTSLVGGFIPLIIYRQTQSLFLSVGYLFCMYLVNIIINLIFKNKFQKHPQLFLLIRAIPILAYSLSVLLIDVNFVWGIILVTIFYAANLSFKGNSTEVILNYSVSQNTNSKSFGMTRVFEQLGSIIAVVAGGLFLDYLETYVLIIVAMSIYIISTIPLLIFYIRSRKNKGFNKELVSNAFMQFSQIEDRSKQGKQVAKKILFQYGVMYFLVAFLDVFCSLYNIFIYVKLGQFAAAGYFNAVYNATFAVSSYLVGYVSAKIDTTILSSVCFIINGICSAIVPFFNNLIVVYVLFGIIGFCYPFYSLFLIERMLAKTRILGVSNRAIFIRENASAMGKAFVLIFALFGTLIPAFIVMGSGLVTAGGLLNASEEHSRKTLVHYLEDDLEDDAIDVKKRKKPKKGKAKKQKS